MNYESITNEFLNYLTPEHKKNIHIEAFKDISKVLIDFHIEQNELHNSKYVCNAPMGHGKSTVITSYLKWITKQKVKQPILLCVREKQLAYEIYKSVSKISPKSIININSDNKDLYEADLMKYQIVIIQQERLKNLCLGFGNLYNYDHYRFRNKNLKRKLIIDERPIFHDSVSYDITSDNNVLEWFDELAKPFNSQPRTIQKIKSYITTIVSWHLADNNTDLTTSLVDKEERKIKKYKELIQFLNDMKEHEQNKDKYNYINALNHFKKLLEIDGYGRIDDYEHNKKGRKIIVSNYIDYSKLKMNIIIFDGTANITYLQYKKGNYQLMRVNNYNDYTRLELYNDQLNTSLYARSKEGNSTQKTIAKRIEQLRRVLPDLFVLPMKNEIKIYHKEKAIPDRQYHLYIDNDESQTKGINLLNTTGKNTLSKVNSLYMTCLPKRNADHYKEIAISLYGNDLSLLTSKDSDNSNWFQDNKLERVYRLELYAELLQIIHRTSLRNIKENERIFIYIAYDDELRSDNVYTNYEPILENLNHNYFNNRATIGAIYRLYNMSSYGRDKTLEGYINAIELMDIKEPIRIGEVSKSFREYIKKHYNNKKDMIDYHLKEKGYKIIEINDRYSSKGKLTKYISNI